MDERVVAAAKRALAARSLGGTMHCLDSEGGGYTKEFVLQGDACAISGPGLVIVTPTEELTSISGERWSRRPIAADAWHREDPRYAFHVLVDGCLSATYGAERYAAANLETGIDRSVAHDLREDGFHSSWTRVAGHVGVSGFGELLEVALRLLGDDEEHWQEWRWDLWWRDIPITLDLPDRTRVVEQEVWFAEQEEHRYR